MNGSVGAPVSDARRIKLDTLIKLRWLAIAGQTGAILFVGIALGYPFPIGWCFALVALSAWLNLFLKLRFPASLRLGNAAAALLLGYDIVQLSVLLFLTGGLENPFSILLLVPVMVSATTLSPRYTVTLGAVVLAISSLLTLQHFPLPWPVDTRLDYPLPYLAGVWVALLCALVFMGIYTFRVAEEGRLLSDALTATELVLAREQHLSALDGLAAAAAHELGTPLATIAVVAKELEREMPPGSAAAEDIALLRSQVTRCREILGRLTSLSSTTDWRLARQPVPVLLAELTEPYRGGGVTIEVTVERGDGPEPIGQRNPAILYGLGNLIENAVDFARSKVEITANWTRTAVIIVVGDDGPGFAPEIIRHIGEPYVTTRATPGSETKPDHEAGGLGLGFFIAKTLLERTGARLELTNRSPPRQGALVRIRWPRAAYEAGPPPVGAPSPSPAAPAWRDAAETI